nr:class IV adenylate cyclase [Tissierella sp.]
MEKELEVKILEMDLDLMEKKILELQGELIADELQINTLIDSSENPIKNKIEAYLRIRETKDLLNGENNVVLTLKKNIKNKDLRENIELNSKIEDKAIVLEILENLGFDKIEVGHKKRRSYSLQGARIDLDEWDKETYPYPYMEIEVKDENQLKQIIDLLEIPQANVSNKSIVQLKEELKQK